MHHHFPSNSAVAMNTNTFDWQALSKKKAGASIAALLLLGFVLAGCSDQSQTSQPPETSTKGKTVIKGSNTIGEELGPRLIAEFKKDHPSAAFELESKATGYGIAGLLAGQADIAAASREPIKDERELAQSRSITMKEYSLGAYCVAVVV